MAGDKGPYTLILDAIGRAALFPGVGIASV
jgi:hypothetical protein